jgi:predicted small integral membrane protein
MNLNWMAWTKPTAAFFIIIFCLLLIMTIWEIRNPGGSPRVGILHFETTRGDRLFISLLGSAYIHIIWLALFGGAVSLWWAFAIACGYALCVFKWV